MICQKISFTSVRLAACMHSMQVVEQALADAGMHKDSIDFLVLHQANQRILDSAAQRLGMPAERVVSNLAGERPSSSLCLDHLPRSAAARDALEHCSAHSPGCLYARKCRELARTASLRWQ